LKKNTGNPSAPRVVSVFILANTLSISSPEKV
jgi:hypothetical protein